MAQVELRRLDPGADESLVREACAWTQGSPRWFRDADSAWGTGSAEDYLEQMRADAQADFGVFDGQEFIAVLTVSLEGKGTYGGHMMAKKGADPEVIAAALASLTRQMFGVGMLEAWLWLARKNYGARKILERVGFIRDGVTRLKGSSHGRPLEWVRYSARAA